MDISIKEVSSCDDPLVPFLLKLLPQLSSSALVPSDEQVRVLLTQESTTVLAATDGRNVFGTTTLVTYVTLTGVRCRVEDVVVSSEARGRGLGRQMTAKAVEHARSAGARTIDLTSRPTRKAANSMYQSMGFELRDSNTYRLALDY